MSQDFRSRTVTKAKTSMDIMPAAFIGHGSPMNTLETNRFTAAWQELGRTVPRPRAILAISAHWFVNVSAVTAMERPPVIHDFYGFPKALFDFDYPAPGSPELAREVAELVKPGFIGLDRDSWGIDHGTWSVLAHLFPKADVPVVQLSVHSGEDMRYHIGLGASLAPLRGRGVFIICSGNVVHNLRRVDWDNPDRSCEWAGRFDAAVKDVMTSRPGQLADLASHPDYGLSVPTPEHFLPLAYLAGLCARAASPAEVLVEGGTLGSITMTSYVLDRPTPRGRQPSGKPAAALPNPATVPPEQTNT
ncbi:4,5-DOPA dioxygenase extradiol [Ramlibacter tataouinensis]|uniref:Candidate Aromatic ring-opening dioxygenase (Catalytic LigB subunit) n=1 Tax=Ramlibacter tataouinensis (strain ATCC BAA-407 / DSM 14655 / LMG 21543 / TTB310) TaxID=365046 RepID=F5XWC8_RAMTT|nr:4,5-DOPA dioxygenase extradiol [Ramlibacter tataouinensis]AEG91698.1 Candidate Aromatic ring-opening dioxygenase (Catalytic LigB subunit) [Ramlibacter tataouinensis TTB310]